MPVRPQGLPFVGPRSTEQDAREVLAALARSGKSPPRSQPTGVLILSGSTPGAAGSAKPSLTNSTGASGRSRVATASRLMSGREIISPDGKLQIRP
jgi:hypothetical protein